MSRFIAVGSFCALVALAYSTLAREKKDKENKEAMKEALQALNDYIGGWKGNGTSEKSTTDIWKENLKWSWRFKKNDIFLVLDIKGSKRFKGGEMRYLVPRKLYQLTLVDRDGKKLDFVGKFKKRRLILEHLDSETKETQQLAMNMAGGGIRMVYTFSHKPANRTLFTKDFQVGLTREGENFGAREKKIECVVSGGLGTIPVMHKGVTYYVCCSGCKEAFLEEPEKYIKEYEEKKKNK
jgi:hypothetical protein